jgi:hypothetical protein
MSAFWTVIIVAVAFGVTAYLVGSLLESFGDTLDAISKEASDEGRPEPPKTRHPHRPIY